MHFWIVNISDMTDRAKIAIENKIKVTYEISIDMNTFDLGPF